MNGTRHPKQNAGDIQQTSSRRLTDPPRASGEVSSHGPVEDDFGVKGIRGNEMINSQRANMNPKQSCHALCRRRTFDEDVYGVNKVRSGQHLVDKAPLSYKDKIFSFFVWAISAGATKADWLFNMFDRDRKTASKRTVLLVSCKFPEEFEQRIIRVGYS